MRGNPADAGEKEPHAHATPPPVNTAWGSFGDREPAPLSLPCHVVWTFCQRVVASDLCLPNGRFAST